MDIYGLENLFANNKSRCLNYVPTDWISCLQIINHMVKRGCVWMWSHDCHKYNGRRWIWSSMPPQLVINVQSVCAVHSSSTAAARCILSAVSLELSKHQTHNYIPSWQPIMWLCDLHIQLREIVRPAKKLGSIYIHMFNEIRSYLYTRVQRN